MALVAAIALPVLLVLVTGSVYLGLLDAMTAFPRSVGGDLIVTEAGGSPIFMRSTSRLPHGIEERVAGVPGVARVDPIHGRLVWVDARGRRGLVFLIGLFDDTTVGVPPQVLAGRARPRLGDVLVDRVLAHDLGLTLGMRLEIAGARLRVAGVTAGGNSVLGTFAFANRNALVLAGTVDPSHLVVRLSPDAAVAAVRAGIKRLGGLQVYDASQFVAENQSLARQFYRPLIGIIAGIAALVGGIVLGLALWAAALEHRAEYGLLRAIGCSRWRVYAVTLWQAGLTTGVGAVLGVVGGALVARLIEAAQPRFVTSVPWWLAVVVAGGALVVGFMAAWVPVRAVTRTDPGLVFRV